jgi:hypothetical protein
MQALINRATWRTVAQRLTRSGRAHPLAGADGHVPLMPASADHDAAAARP